ncbi:hypothetical protein NQ314_015734 [Rhamnusium bicolor]|uniref:Uncharacterized protein n=1 Tax=Rhamnusium bicolor TaxID=1586634 RepID=A0AAV8WY22_9CUCU|nr:hypothetical protein NQ314_015734 [Rhamnusium bicolor]
MNRSILSALMASTNDETCWDSVVSQVQWGINSTINSTAGKSPYELFFGYRPRGINDTFLSAEVSYDESPDLERVRDDTSRLITEKQR